MKMQSVALGLFLTNTLCGLSQGLINLDFENASFVVDPAGQFYPSSVYASNAIPGWTAYLGGVPQTDINSNGISLGDPAIFIETTNGGFYPPMHGNYFILLQGSYQEIVPNTAAIGQTGQIPATAQSMSFWANLSMNRISNNLQVTFNGSTIPYSVISAGSGYTIYGADISAFAGQTGQLLFTAGYDTAASLDNIQFSPSAIPEPSALSLSALGGLLLAWRRWRHAPRP